MLFFLLQALSCSVSHVSDIKTISVLTVVWSFPVCLCHLQQEGV